MLELTPPFAFGFTPEVLSRDFNPLDIVFGGVGILLVFLSVTALVALISLAVSAIKGIHIKYIPGTLPLPVERAITPIKVKNSEDKLKENISSSIDSLRNVTDLIMRENEQVVSLLQEINSSLMKLAEKIKDE